MHIRLLAEEGFLAGVGAAFDELDDGNLEAVAEGAGDDTESGRGFALAVAGVDQQHAAFFLGRCNLVVDDSLLLLHALFVGNAHDLFRNEAALAAIVDLAQRIAVEFGEGFCR